MFHDTFIQNIRLLENIFHSEKYAGFIVESEAGNRHQHTVKKGTFVFCDYETLTNHKYALVFHFENVVIYLKIFFFQYWIMLKSSTVVFKLLTINNVLTGLLKLEI